MHLEHFAGVDLNLLVALGHLFETRSVTAAAARMRLTQPALSRALGRLRTAFGDPLFVRSSSGLLPTPRAEALRPLLEEALGRLEAVVAGPEAFEPRRSTRQFTVASADYGQAVLLPALLDRLRREAPGASVRFVPKTGELEASLATGAWDVCWVPRLKEDAARTVVWNRLLDEDFTFVVRAGHPVARGPFTLERFLSVTQVALAPEGKPGNRVDEALARLGRARRVVALVPSFLVVPGLLAGSDLGAVLPARLYANAAARFGLVSLPLPFQPGGFDLSQAWHERLRRDPGHAWFRQFVRAVASGL